MWNRPRYVRAERSRRSGGRASSRARRCAFRGGAGLARIVSATTRRADPEEGDEGLRAAEADAGVRGVEPEDRHLGDPVAEPPGEEERLDVEGEAVDGGAREDLPRRVAGKSLKPHCVSRIPETTRSRTRRLKSFPLATRKSDCRSFTSVASTPREPMATGAPAARSLSTSSIGVERSASVTRTCSPAAARTPARTAAPLPRFSGRRITRKARPSRRRSSRPPRPSGPRSRRRRRGPRPRAAACGSRASRAIRARETGSRFSSL